MNKLTCIFTMLLTGFTLAAQEVIRPKIAKAFGRPFVVTAEFVDKSNDYYSQNLIEEPYVLKVVKVNSEKLPQPVVIEYKLESEEKPPTKIEQKGLPTTFEAYETVYQPATATPWLKEMEQGTQFSLHHLLHIRPEQKKANNGTGANSR